MGVSSFPLADQPWLILAVFVIVVAASVVQAGLGMGFGLTAAPLLALIVSTGLATIVSYAGFRFGVFRRVD